MRLCFYCQGLNSCSIELCYVCSIEIPGLPGAVDGDALDVDHNLDEQVAGEDPHKVKVFSTV